MSGVFRPPTDEQRCKATTSKGARCSKFRVKGVTVCMTHGGSIGRVKEAAERRVADAQARELARKVDVDVTKFHGDPIEALRDLLARDQAEMERYARLAARFEDSELTYTTKSGAEQLRAVLGAYQTERDALGRRLDLMLRAGVAERLMQTREAETKVGQQGLVSMFGMCLTLFLGDISSALATVGVYDQHDQVMAEIQRRVRFRLQHENSMIITQIENMATADRRSGEDRR